ncbi:hypothetical protein DH2020_048844 [Rehmannia glutinosa]|uniref:NPH3 domain-containing protein n=1 Tax=Rehmannia glutinosa TaxID=99300 RepID=A0ABR0U4E4_REHGL
MKLGSKPDQFQTDGDTIRYVATELATDMVVSVGDVKFYVHKSSQLQKLVATTSDDNNDEIDIHDIPGGPAAFEICAKFCYGMVVTLNAYNVVAARCAAEYLEMYETVEKGNLIYKIDVFLSSSIFRSWKDSIIVLQTTKSLLPWSEELKIVSHCLDSIASRASTDPSKVDWSYTYNRKKLSSENGLKKQQMVPKDWWVEDLCELQIDLYKRVITTIRAKGRISPDVIGESLKAYSSRRLPVFNKGTVQGGDLLKYCYLVDTITFLLPTEKNSVHCNFLLKLLQASIMLGCGETVRRELMQRIARQLDEATVGDLLIRSPSGDTALYNVDVVYDLVEQFVMQEHSAQTDGSDDNEFPEICTGFSSDASREHPGLTKSEKKRICRLMDCKKLSAKPAHTPCKARGSPCGSSCRSATTNSDEDWDGDQTSEELKDLKGELASLRLRNKGGADGESANDEKLSADKVTAKKVKKIFSRLWSNKDRHGEISSSDTSESPASTSAEEGQLTTNQMQKKSLDKVKLLLILVER